MAIFNLLPIFCKVGEEMGKLSIFVVMAGFSHVYVLSAEDAVTVLLKGPRRRFMRLT